MNVLPIVEREMRIGARRSATYYTRCLAAALAAIAAITLLYAGFANVMTPGAIGQSLFLVLAAIAYVYAILEGAILTANSLSRERRENTLGLLFLTDLKARDILAGKLASSVGRTMYSLMAALPIPGITIFLGGVTLADLLMMMAAVLNALFFTTAIGLCVSAYAKSERRAFSLTMGFALLAGVFWPIVGFVVNAATGGGAGPLFLLVSPAGPLTATLNFGGTRFPAPDYWSSLAMTQTMAWGLLIMAGRALQRTWRDNPSPQTRASLLRRMFRRDKKTKTRRLPEAQRKCWLDRNPIVWLGERAGNPRRQVKSMLLVSAVVNLPFIFIDFEHWFGVAFLGCNSVLFHLMCGSAAFDQTCRSVIDDRKSGALELLLTTRLDPHDFIDGRLLAQMRLLVSPLCLALINDILLLAALWVEYPPEAAAAGTALVLGWMTLQYLGHIASCWSGLWYGFKTGSAAAATRRFCVLLLGTPAAALAASVALWGAITQGRGFQEEFLVMGGIWGLTLLFISATAHLGHMVSDLRDNFRALARESEPSAPRPSKPWMFWRPAPETMSQSKFRSQTTDPIKKTT